MINKRVSDNINGDLIKIWLEEYKAIAADIQNRVTLQHGLMNYLLLIISAAAVVISSLLKDNMVSKYQDALQIFLLVLPILFAFFVWRHANHDINIIDKASYINKVIRPNLAILTGDVSLLGFDRFLEKERQKRKQYGYLIILGGEHFFHSLFSFLSLIAAIFAFFSGPGHFAIASTLEELPLFLLVDILLLTDIILFIMTIKLKIKVGYAYSSIVNESNDIWC